MVLKTQLPLYIHAKALHITSVCKPVECNSCSIVLPFDWCKASEGEFAQCHLVCWSARVATTRVAKALNRGPRINHCMLIVQSPIVRSTGLASLGVLLPVAVRVQPHVEHGHGDRPGVVSAVKVEVGTRGGQELHREEAIGATGGQLPEMTRNEMRRGRD